MSRVLKFRAWDKEKNRWVREWDRELEDQDDQIYEKEYSEDSYWLDGDVASALDLVNGRLGLDRYIWEQCTGLSDKNGTPIYEGDIIKVQYPAADDYFAEVKYEYAGFEPFIIPVGDYNNYLDGDMVEVVGNIHQKKWTPDDA